MLLLLILGCLAATISCWLPPSFIHALHLLPPIASLSRLSISPLICIVLHSFSPPSFLAHILSFHVFCTAPPPPPPLLCPSSLSLFFLRALGGAPCGPVFEVFLHRPQPGPPPLSGRGAGSPPPPVLLPPPPLPKLAHLRPRPPRVPLRSAPGPRPPYPQPHAQFNHLLTV